MGQQLDSHTYRLQLTGDEHAEPRDIEFDAFGSDVALLMTFKLCGSRPFTMYEDGNKLADLKYNQGFWEIG